MGVKARRIENYYQKLLDPDTKNDNSMEQQIEAEEASKTSSVESLCIPEKWKGQIEKVIT